MAPLATVRRFRPINGQLDTTKRLTNFVAGSGSRTFVVLQRVVKVKDKVLSKWSATRKLSRNGIQGDESAANSNETHLLEPDFWVVSRDL